MRKILLSLAVLALAVSPVIAGEYNKKITIGQKAPSFDGLPAVMGPHESTLAMSDIKEDVVVVVFLANHCPAVVANEDRLIDLANSYKGKSVKIVGISCTGDDRLKSQDDIPAIKTRVKEKGYNYIYAYDESGKVGKAYNATKTPEFYVLDKARNIQYTGALDNSVFEESKSTKNYVKDAVDALLAGKSVEKTETAAIGCGLAYGKTK